MPGKVDMSELSKQERAAIVESLGLTVDSVFVPFSQSRNKGNKEMTLNWAVTVRRNGREVLTTDYSAGIAHAPSYNAKAKTPSERDLMLRAECETGQRSLGMRWGHRGEVQHGTGERNAIKPDAIDVLYSLAMDSDVLDYPSFEDWASNFGYEVDSRKAETTYRACLDIALKLRASLGDDGLQTLRNAFEGY